MVNKIQVNFVMHRFATGGVERMLINIAETLNGVPFRLIILNNDFDDIIKSIPSHIEIYTFQDSSFIKTLSKLKRFNFLKVFINLLIFLVQLLIVKFSGELKARHNINFSDTISTLILTYVLPGRMVSWIHLNPGVLSKSRYKRFYNLMFGRCSQIICICFDQRDKFLKVFEKIKPENVCVVYNTINTKSIDLMCGENNGLPAEPYMLVVSRLDNRSKDFITIIDAYFLLDHGKSSIPNLYIVGEGPDRDLIQNYINSKGLSGKILLAGNDANPYKWMTHAHLFLFSSKSEGFGLVLLEAMYCGVAVIATDCEVGPREILEDGKFGVLVKVGDTIGFKNAITNYLAKSLINSLDLRESKKRAMTFSIGNSSVKSILGL